MITRRFFIGLVGASVVAAATADDFAALLERSTPSARTTREWLRGLHITSVAGGQVSVCLDGHVIAMIRLSPNGGWDWYSPTAINSGDIIEVRGPADVECMAFVSDASNKLTARRVAGGRARPEARTQPDARQTRLT